MYHESLILHAGCHSLLVILYGSWMVSGHLYYSPTQRALGRFCQHAHAISMSDTSMRLNLHVSDVSCKVTGVRVACQLQGLHCSCWAYMYFLGCDCTVELLLSVQNAGALQAGSA